MNVQNVGKDIILFESSDFPIIVNAGRRAGNEKSFFHEEIEIKYVVSGRVTKQWLPRLQNLLLCMSPAR